MLRVCLTLFNLQGARRFVVRRTNDILSQAPEFVKHFFQVFSKLCFAVLFSPCRSRQLAYISTPQGKSQPLIFSFFDFFHISFLCVDPTFKKALYIKGFPHSWQLLISKKTRTAMQPSFFCKQKSSLRRKKETVFRLSLLCWRYLFFRPVSRQVSSA